MVLTPGRLRTGKHLERLDDERTNNTQEIRHQKTPGSSNPNDAKTIPRTKKKQENNKKLN
tara:strand:- start:2296 stop:2475 length:180 start_codon:yes stop_codon:yes gene_type:complete